MSARARKEKRKAGGNASFGNQSRTLPCAKESSVKKWGLHAWSGQCSAFAGREEGEGTIVGPTTITGRGQVRNGLFFFLN